MKNKIKNLFKTYFPSLFQFFKALKQKMATLYYSNVIRESWELSIAKLNKKSYGEENADKTFFVIQWSQKWPAFAGLMNIVISYIDYAERNGYIPIVDFGSFSNCYVKENDIGKTNIWEWFFEQPAGYSLEDIKNSKNIIYSPNKLVLTNFPKITILIDNCNNNDAKKWANIYKKYIKMNIKTQELFQASMDAIISKHDKVLSIKARGTDYKASPPGHPNYISHEELIKDTQSKMKENKYDKIFLSSEDEEIAVDFKKVFGDVLVMNEDKFKTIGDQGYVTTDDDAYQDLYDYLSTLWIASKCQAISCVACGGAMMIWYMQEEKKDFFNVHYNGLNF